MSSKEQILEQIRLKGIEKQRAANDITKLYKELVAIQKSCKHEGQDDTSPCRACGAWFSKDEEL